MIKKSTILKIFNILFWLMVGAGLSFILISGVVKERKQTCLKVQVDFLDKKLINMIDQREIYNDLWPGMPQKYPLGKNISSFNLFALEQRLSKNPWIQDANIYFDNQHTLHIDVLQKSPVARLFTAEGYSYYLDDAFNLLPLKQTDHIVLPVFTNYYVNPTGMKKTDSAVLSRIISLSTFITNDPFWMAQIESIYIRPDYTFELSTQVGEHSIDLGSRSDWEPMFNKLKLLYQKLNEEDSWNRYSHINLQYKDQIVCEKSGVKLLSADSLHVDTLTVIQPIIHNNINKNTNPSKK